jgi:hypothetical protein
MTEINLNNVTAYKTLPTVKSVDTDWIKWSDTVMSKYGLALGKEIFLTAWKKRGSKAANTYTFRKHIKDSYGLEIDESVWDKVVDLGGGIGETFGKMFRVGKVVLFIGGAVVLVAAGAAIYNTVKGGVSPLKALKK